MVFLVLLVLVPLSTAVYLLRRKENARSETFQKRFGELVMELKLRDRMTLMYPVLFMARRLAYAAILINLLAHNYFQVQLVVVKAFLFMLYIGSLRPYESKLANFVEFFNEVVSTLCAYILVTFTEYVPDAQTRYEYGWLIIVAIMCMIVVNLVIICYSTIANCIYKCKLRCLRRKAIK